MPTAVLDATTQSYPPVRLLVLYDASGNHDEAYFRNLRRLVRVNYAKSTSIHAHIAQSTDNKPRCPSKFRCKVLRAIGSRLEESRFFRYTPDRRFEKCTGQFDAYYLDSTTLAKVNRDVARVSDDYPGTMLMLRRMSDLRHVLDIANNNAPRVASRRSSRRFSSTTTSSRCQSHDKFNQEDATQRRISKDDKCSVIIFNNLLHLAFT